MTDLSTKTALVFDHGLFVPVAVRLAEDFGRVLYWSPYEEGFSKWSKACLGDGGERIERCKDYWKAKNEVDVWVFPDIEHSGLQEELVSQGRAVWGSRSADSLELDRQKFLRVLEEVGLEVPPHTVVHGLADLREFLKDKEDQYIKISKYRGDRETYHWRNWKLDRYILDWWAVQDGPLQDDRIYLVFPTIDTDVEIGADTYNVGGRWPSLMLHGIEWKDKAYFAAVTKREEMPEQLQAVLEAFGPILGQYGCGNEWSSEIRVDGDHSYFIDPTQRGGLPSTGSQMTLWKNFPQIVWAGAHGELVEPEHDDLFSMECIVTGKRQRGMMWSVAEVPDELKPWLKLASCCWKDDLTCFPVDDSHEEDLGWLVATGKTPQQTLETMQERAGLLPDGLHADITALADIIKEIESAEEQGVPFTDQPVPEPEAVLKYS